MSVIDQVVAKIALELKEWPALGSLGLHLFTQSQNFIGYFVKSPYHEFIEKLMITVQQEFLKAGKNFFYKL